jgi:hypothetical protein
MPKPLAVFQSNIQDANALTGVFDHLAATLGGVLSLDDLLRSKIVYSVSAFDKLIHDLVRIGMVEIFVGKRAPTPKYNNEPISLLSAQLLSSAITPPPEVVFDQIIQAKHKILAFQDPDKVADALSFIWTEQQKWQCIAAAINMQAATLRTTLKLIVSRRNAIVHEADMDPTTNTKLPICKQEADDVSDLLLRSAQL